VAGAKFSTIASSAYYDIKSHCNTHQILALRKKGNKKTWQYEIFFVILQQKEE